jgi:hypothetical protein
MLFQSATIQGALIRKANLKRLSHFSAAMANGDFVAAV